MAAKPPAAKHSRAPKLGRDDVLARALREREREVIAEYLKKHDGNVSATAAALGIGRQALDAKLDAHDLRETAALLREKAGITGPRTV